MNSIIKISLFIIFCLSIFFCLQNTVYAQNTGLKEPPLQIKIPTIHFTADKDKWIGEYIKGIYEYGIMVVGILAAVVLMWAGLLWLTSGGSMDKVKQAKSWIAAALTGLVIALSSYVILYTVNPDLVIFGPIKIEKVKSLPKDRPVKGEELPDFGFLDDHDWLPPVTTYTGQAPSLPGTAPSMPFTSPQYKPLNDPLSILKNPVVINRRPLTDGRIKYYHIDFNDYREEPEFKDLKPFLPPEHPVFDPKELVLPKISYYETKTSMPRYELGPLPSQQGSLEEEVPSCIFINMPKEQGTPDQIIAAISFKNAQQMEIINDYITERYPAEEWEIVPPSGSVQPDARGYHNVSIELIRKLVD